MSNKAAMLGLAVLAFLVAAVLVIMIFRMLFGGRLRMPGGRARQARLGIVDAFDLDRQRQLIIVRRDNTEHLIMIGGPNDVVIEAEIIRAEGREMRREPGLTQGYGDGGRIPAPMAAIEKPEAALPSAQAGGSFPAADQPPLPLPLPTAADTQPEPAPGPARGPTFPLPPRRPAPAQPERRPASPPPKLPESVSRGEEVPSLSGQPPAAAPAPSRPMPPPPATRPPSPPQPSAPTAPPPVAPAGPAAPLPAGPTAAPAPRPPFLKPPAPPRPAGPPARPLPRATPQQPMGAPPAAGVPGANGPTPGPMPRPPIGARPPGSPPPARPSQPPPPAASAPPPTAPQTDASPDAMESLEEEMAKLLGRGS